MADFFRYNVKKGMEDATIREEVETVENYIYILNVRFAGEIHYSSEVDQSVLDYRVPSMMLQPLVENAVNHGIRGIDWQGEVKLVVRDCEEEIEIRVEDNGKGMSEEQIRQIYEGSRGTKNPETTGIGVSNVISRLKLYYNTDSVLEIASGGPGRGTTVILKIPRKEEERDVSDIGG